VGEPLPPYILLPTPYLPTSQMDLLRSLPLGLYLEEPQSWLHKIDPRVKFLWLMSFLTTYIFANNNWRILLVVCLIVATLISRIPRRIWQQPQQMLGLLLLSVFVLAIGAITPDGLGLRYQNRLPPPQITIPQPARPNPSLSPSPSTPQLAPKQASQTSAKPYRYVRFETYLPFGIGPIQVTRRSLDLAIKLSTLLFTILYSTNLYLLTTAPEEITAALESLMQPLRRFKLPITEVTLTLTLSLRFIPLVLEEIQNLVRAIMTRAINWKKLGFKGALKIWLVVTERLLENLLLRADQMASAMTVRGFTSPNEHRVQWHDLKLKRRDWLAIVILVLFWGVRIVLGNEV
jgi:energy-coupling factor transport system permease protein